MPTGLGFRAKAAPAPEDQHPFLRWWRQSTGIEVMGRRGGTPGADGLRGSGLPDGRDDRSDSQCACGKRS